MLMWSGFVCRTVIEVGPGVKRLKVGDRVAIEPGVPCWSNKASRYALSRSDPCTALIAALACLCALLGLGSAIAACCC